MLRTVDRRTDAPDEVRHAMALAVDRAPVHERNAMSRYIATAGSADYESAFKKILADPVNGHREFSTEELRAFQQVRQETRALNLTDGNGGYLVPATVDFSVQLSSTGSVNPLRGLARHVTTAGNDWAGITSAGSSASWDAEAAQVSDDSPTFVNPTIPVHKGAVYVQASLEVAMDASIANVLGPIFADARDQLESTAFTLGTGSGQPKGIITAVAAVGGSVVTSAGSALTVADVTANQNALPPRWRPRARWMANLATVNAGRQLPLYTNGPALVSDATNPPQMMGWPVYENSQMDGTIAAGTTNDYVLLSGDFSQFVIVDRIGLTVQYIPAVFSTTNNRPTGEVGWYAYWRAGSDVLVTDAFRLTNYSG
jgi:HK97 family phage major capsid protein